MEQGTSNSSNSARLSPGKCTSTDRLKAFNMFVRMFVDENLDRSLPISKQPKEVTQAIIDACVRQFPELAERSRKRIRTYLKSCRRNQREKRFRPSHDISISNICNGTEHIDSVMLLNQKVANLQSTAAEKLLIEACENEELIAKEAPSASSSTDSDPNSITTNASNGWIGDMRELQNEANEETQVASCTFGNGTIHHVPVSSIPQMLIESLLSNNSTLTSQKPARDFLKNSITNASANANAQRGADLGGASAFLPPFIPTSSFNGASAAQLLSHAHPKNLNLQLNLHSQSRSQSQSLSLSQPQSQAGRVMTDAERQQMRQQILAYRQSAAYLIRSANELEYLLDNPSDI